MDGWVTIGTKLDSKQLEKDLKRELQQLEKFEKEAEKMTKQKIEIEAEIELKGKEFDRKIEEIKAKAEAQKIGLGTTTAKDITTREKIDTTAQAKINSLTQQYNQYLEQADSKIVNINKEIKENAYNQGLTNNKISELNSKLGKVKGFNNIKNSVEDVGKSVEKVTKKIAHWGIAVFGIRSAYMFVRNAINTIANDDEQLKADIDYMKSAIAYTLEPLVRTIVNLAKQLMFYVGYIVKALTGKNIFENANKSLKSATGSAKALNKELNKTIAGFDEMNVLQDTSTSGSGDTSGGITTPSFDLTNLEDYPIPSWLQWILVNKDAVIAGLAGIAAGLGALKLGFSGIQALGIGIAVAGIVLTIQKINDFLNDPTFDNFIGILKGIAMTVTGVAIAFEAWPVAIGGAIALVVLLIVKHFDEIKALFNKLISWLDKNVLGALKNLFGPVGNLLYAPIKWFVEMAKGAFEGFYGGIKTVINGVMKIFKGDFFGGIKDIFGGLLSIMLAPLRGFLSGAWGIIQQIYGFFRDLGGKVGEVLGGAFKTVINGVLGAIETILNFPIKQINKLINTINKVPGINIGKLSTFSLPRLAKGGIVNNPGPGVMMGSYIAGEKGPEAIIPLDDNTLDRLGLAFARHTVINATMINQMNGRVISRELQKINNESNFAFNR